MRYSENDAEDHCGRCKYRTKDSGDWICNNQDSDCYGCVMDYTDVCDSFEDKTEGVRRYEWPK